MSENKKENQEDNLYNKIALLTSQLHNALKELSYFEKLHNCVQDLPDAQNRLFYISKLTNDAAEKVLTNVDNAKNEKNKIIKENQELKAELINNLDNKKVIDFLDLSNNSLTKIDSNLTEIMLAQEFQDLSGQIINQLIKVITSLENGLLDILLQTNNKNQVNLNNKNQDKYKLLGPNINSNNKHKNTLNDQSLVDDLFANI